MNDRPTLSTTPRTRRSKLLLLLSAALVVQAVGTIAWSANAAADSHQDVPQTIASIVMPTPLRVMPAPYGLDRGTCDRSALSTDIVAGKPRRSTVGGGVLGALISADLGRAMDEADQVCVAQALEYAPDRARIAWAAHDGEQLTIAPETTFEREGGWCRTYRATAESDGRRTTTLGTACRGPDGLWRANG
ncbi:hypothetical protein [Roseiterribacter gracilis]|uniref:Surface antigen domain-containing protein n=1 Tax=Roseiterribacter gracilis TaxID=2812848 RepID=A0A8S8X8V5_9PROT|nr:hypothetical protein TMPK1_21400 [Rhodospirillales bacterium TMPK1]